MWILISHEKQEIPFEIMHDSGNHYIHNFRKYALGNAILVILYSFDALLQWWNLCEIVEHEQVVNNLYHTCDNEYPAQRVRIGQ